MSDVNGLPKQEIHTGRNFSVGQVRVCSVQYVFDRVNRRDRFPLKKPLRSFARGASFHTKHASNVNGVKVVLLGANSYLALSSQLHLRCLRG
jgi:hypothetical protein